MRDINLELKELAIALHLNIAACAAKLDNLNQVIISCSFILEVDKRSVKVVFRRGLALVKLSLLEKAYDDLTKAREVKPNNKDIARELRNLERSREEGTKFKKDKTLKESITRNMMSDAKEGVKRKGCSEKELPQSNLQLTKTIRNYLRLMRKTSGVWKWRLVPPSRVENINVPLRLRIWRIQSRCEERVDLSKSYGGVSSNNSLKNLVNDTAIMQRRQDRKKMILRSPSIGFITEKGRAPSL